jgi:hypothetical protein
MHHIYWPILTVVGSLAGGYFGAYLKTKAQNLATHEDIDKLVVQVKAVTTATKEIEAKISIDVWDRQKRWEIKRDAIFETVKNVGPLTDALTGLQSVFKAAQQSGDPENLLWKANKLEAVSTWTRISTDFERTKLLTSLVCGKEVQKAFATFNVAIRRIVGGIISGDINIFDQSIGNLLSDLNNLIAAIRKELRIDEPV